MNVGEGGKKSLFGRRGGSHLLLVEEGRISGAQAYKAVSRRGARG